VEIQDPARQIFVVRRETSSRNERIFTPLEKKYQKGTLDDKKAENVGENRARVLAGRVACRYAGRIGSTPGYCEHKTGRGV